jgi:hypothetical protein
MIGLDPNSLWLTRLQKPTSVPSLLHWVAPQALDPRGEATSTRFVEISLIMVLSLAKKSSAKSLSCGTFITVMESAQL